MLYECLTGASAFPGTTPIEVLGKITSGAYEDLDESTAPPWLKETIRLALSFNSQERPADDLALANLIG